MNECPCCFCPMSVINPDTCQNCDYQTNWTIDQIESYTAKLVSDDLAIDSLVYLIDS